MADAIIYLKHYRSSVRVQKGMSKIYSILDIERNKQWITHLKTFLYHNAILFIFESIFKVHFVDHLKYLPLINVTCDAK